MPEGLSQEKIKTPEQVVNKGDENIDKNTSTAEIESSNKVRMREDISDMRAKMLVAESAYLRAARLARDKHPAGLRKGRVNELRDAYDQTRADFSNKVNESVKSRLSEGGRGMAFTMQNGSGEAVTKKVPYTEMQKKEIERRYNRMVLTRDTVDRAHSKRLEILPERERNPFKKVLGWYVRANSRMEAKIARVITPKGYDHLTEPEKFKKQKTARKIARGLRILTFAGIGVGTGLVASVGSYILRSVAGIFAGTYAAKKMGNRFMRTKGAARAQHLATARENTGKSSIESVRGLDMAYKKDSSEALEKSRGWRELFYAVAIGGGVSMEAAHMLDSLPSVGVIEKSISQLPSTVHDATASASQEIEKLSSEAHGVATEAMHDVENFSSKMHHSISSALAEHKLPATPDVSHAQVPAVYEAVVDKGQGSDALFEHLKQTLQKTYPDPNNAPPIVKHLLNTSQHSLSDQYGFDKDGASMVLHHGETLEVKGDELIFLDSKGASHVLSSVENGRIVQGEVFTYFDRQYLQNAPTHGITVNGNEVISQSSVSLATPHGSEVLSHTAEAISTPHGSQVLSQTSATIATPSGNELVSHTSKAISTAHGSQVTAHSTEKIFDSSGNEVLSHSSESIVTQSGALIHPDAPHVPVAHHGADVPTHSVGMHNHDYHVDKPQGIPNVMNESVYQNIIDKYGNSSVSEVLYGNSHIQSKFHDALINTVSKSGIGPSNNETIAHFLERAQDNVATHASHVEHLIGVNNLHVPIHQTHLYETANGEIVCFGGSFDARSMIAYDYLSSHHGAHVLLEGAHDTSATDISSSGSFIADRMGTSLRSGTFIPPSQFTGHVSP